MKRRIGRIAGVVVVVVAGALLLGPGLAAAPTAPPAHRSVKVKWTLTAAQCPNLPTGTTVTGTGRLHKDQDGRVYIEHATGRATDQAGNVYLWAYNFRAVSRSGDSELWVDHFVMAPRGDGPALLNNGFIAVVSPDGVDVLHEYGDPYNFETDSPICDPL
jgi:hypothetical protein